MDKITEIVTRIFKVPAEAVSPLMSPETTPSWDSMNYLLLVSELERVLAVQFTMDEVMGVKTLGDIINLLRGKRISL